MRIEIAGKTGFCFGVKRAIVILENASRERNGIETLGAVVHNQQVLDLLEKKGIKVVKNLNQATGGAIATSSHGVGPELEEEIRSRGIKMISTTCPFVRRAQVSARRLADSGYTVVIYGDVDHPEVKGILGWTKGRGIATLDGTSLRGSSRRIGILSQTTQIPSRFTEFVKSVIDSALVKDVEIRVIDTICHDIRERQAAALDLAHRVDLMLVIGGHSSANSNRLAELCSTATESRLIETAGEISIEMLNGKESIGITAGASTAEETVSEVVARLKRT